jgi:hypothetical protein
VIDNKLANSSNIFQRGLWWMPEDAIGFTMNRYCHRTKGLQQSQSSGAARAAVRIDQYPR